MIQVIEDMPVGTIGLEASGKVTDDDYRDVLVPVVEAALERGKVRLMYVVDEHASYSLGAIWADTKVGFRDLKGWERVAIVSDADWLEHAVKAFGWMVPGEVKVFELTSQDAKAWLVGIDDDEVGGLGCRIDAGRLWGGGVATGLVAALVAWSGC